MIQCIIFVRYGILFLLPGKGALPLVKHFIEVNYQSLKVGQIITGILTVVLHYIW